MTRSDRSRARRTAAALAGAALLAPLLAAMPSEAAPGPASGAPVANAQAAWLPPAAVVLITGDVVRIRTLADGEVSVKIDPAGSDRTFSRYTDADGDVHVVPAPLLPLIPERLDPRLFNVSALARDGYGAADRQDLPLIITYASPTGTAAALPGATVSRSLPSIDGVAVTLDREGALRLGAALLRTDRETGAMAGVEKIWLDGPMTAALDESTPQIGAPAAWDQGYDGADVTIAVVDTGIDESHPDVGSRVIAAEEFADTGSTTDVFGHGTHVASIAAGSGAASGGQYTGVAYGADLVNAKVLDDTGSGFESWVIAGMEWSAVDQDADVINMSLTGGYSDGTDPVSQAVNNLSVDENALFVTAAGNFGGAAGTVETPSTADAALAVGAVDKTDVYAEWSGQGPRLDSFAVKPEIVAPGVEITAARAEGADIGPPVGEDYMELTGTSMAAPHVAGAAALLLQANPGWGWSDLKNALVTSAVDVGATAFQQGGGRVDVTAALDQTVHSDVATINLGSLEFPHDDGEISTAEVTFTNDGDTEVSLDLTVAGSGEDGEGVPAGMITLDAASLVLAPGASDTATVTFDPEVGPYGLISGSLTGTVDGVEAIRLPLGAEKQTEVFDLTIEVKDLEGSDQIFGTLVVFDLDTGAYFEFFDIFEGGTTVEAQVPEGMYAALFQGFQGDAIVTLAAPEFDVASDLTMVLDGRDANEATYDVGVDTEIIGASASIGRGTDVTGIGMSAAAFGEARMFAAPTEPVTIGTFDYSTEWVATAEEIHYLLTLPEPDVIPADLTYVFGPDDLAEITSALSSDVDRRYGFGRLAYTETGGGGGFGFEASSRSTRRSTRPARTRTSAGSRARSGRRSIRSSRPQRGSRTRCTSASSRSSTPIGAGVSPTLGSRRRASTPCRTPWRRTVR